MMRDLQHLCRQVSPSCQYPILCRFLRIPGEEKINGAVGHFENDRVVVQRGEGKRPGGIKDPGRHTATPVVDLGNAGKGVGNSFRSNQIGEILVGLRVIRLPVSKNVMHWQHLEDTD